MYCSTCHQPSGEGTLGPYRSLKDSKRVRGSKEKLISVIWYVLQTGTEAKGEQQSITMRQHDYLTDNVTADTATHVWQKFGNNVSAISKGEV